MSESKIPEPRSAQLDALGGSDGSEATATAVDVGSDGAPLTRPGLPPIPSRDVHLRRTVRRWMERRPELADDQYVDLLVMKSMLRRHQSKLSAQLSKNGVLNKTDGKPKAALDALLSISAEMRRIDSVLPAPPQPEQVRRSVEVLITAVSACPHCGEEIAPGAEEYFDNAEEMARSRSGDETAGSERPLLQALAPEQEAAAEHEADGARQHIVEIRSDGADGDGRKFQEDPGQPCWDEREEVKR